MAEPVRVTIRWRSGMVEDVPIDVAYRLLENGEATAITPLAPRVETAMLEDPEPRGRPRRNRRARGS